ncbi:hypothetical protein GCM10010168_44740 [Actinoplanes ianthinogenes]|uniref:Lipoprotein n=1 Tax=Actinoplanes ianthinogenes TaxID=122358 RepID=A0ABM7LPL8_9ACTN|nr:hypothetical protein [Actinoplanes ianthinogenes]BCJ41228.1 hypothetical protein Aiant_18850 [Actinoplanes ianthinogenes]GGR22047.1 hypothetical protein GCM10010168_44740 [Actinoplanes ianthinogenes]
MLRRRIAILGLAASVVVLAACSSTAEPSPTGAPPSPAAVATTAVDKTEAATALDAGAIMKKLSAAGLGLTAAAEQNEDTDPNDLLGRPNGYTSRASADLPGGDKSGEKYSVERGLVVEVFADADGAKRRSDYIQGLQKENPILGTEWHYFTGDERGLVRVSGKVKPSLAKKVEAAVSGL